MQIEITSRLDETPSALRDYITKELLGLERFGEEFEGGEMFLSLEGAEVQCEGLLRRHRGEALVASDRHDDIRVAVDNVVAKLGRQILKSKEKPAAKARRRRSAD